MRADAYGSMASSDDRESPAAIAEVSTSFGSASRQPSSLPQLFAGALHSLARNALGAWRGVCFKNEQRHRSQWYFYSRRPFLISYVREEFLSCSPFPSWSLPTISAIAAPLKSASAQNDGAASQAPFAEEVAARAGPAFIGQVFTMCDASRRGLIAVRPAEARKTKCKLPFVPSFLNNMLSGWLEKTYESANKDENGAVFRFYFDKDDAAGYVKQVGVAGSMVGSCPLDSAYKYFKSNPHVFRFVPDGKQVKVAKELLKKGQGKRMARMFTGIPVFTARNLTIAMSTSNGVRWFTPYFFDKEHLDKLIGHSVDHYYHVLIHARRNQRHNQVIDNDNSGEVGDDEADNLLDPAELQEFMEEMGHAGSTFDSVMVKAAEIHFQDMLDNIILGNRLSRQLTGLQPSFPVLVDSFERRAAAAENLKDEPKGSSGNDDLRANNDGSSTRDSGNKENSGRSAAENGITYGRGRKPRAGKARSPFQLFGKDWGFQIPGCRKEITRGVCNNKINTSEDELGSSYTESHRKPLRNDEEPMERVEPKLTMMGIAMTESDSKVTDAVFQRAMADAAKDIEDRVRKGEGSGQEHGPLFIADLGGPPEIWEENPNFPGWESDDNE